MMPVPMGMMMMTAVVVVMIVPMTMTMIMVMIVRVIAVRADTFDVMMMAFLPQSDLRFEAQNLFAILAHLAVHVAGAFQDLPDAVGEGFQHQRMVVQIGRLDELDTGMPGGDDIGVIVNAAHQ